MKHIKSKLRGHAIHLIEPDKWMYSDTNTPTAGDRRDHCGHCGHRRKPDSTTTELKSEPHQVTCPQCRKAYRKQYGFSIRLIFEPCDLWVGLFWDKKRRILYVLPVPCLGLRIKFKAK